MCTVYVCALCLCVIWYEGLDDKVKMNVLYFIHMLVQFANTFCNVISTQAPPVFPEMQLFSVLTTRHLPIWPHSRYPLHPELNRYRCLPTSQLPRRRRRSFHHIEGRREQMQSRADPPFVRRAACPPAKQPLQLQPPLRRLRHVLRRHRRALADPLQLHRRAQVRHTEDQYRRRSRARLRCATTRCTCARE